MQEIITTASGGSNGRTAGFPSDLVARVAKADPVITIEEMSGEGDIKFSVPLQAAGLTRPTMNRAGLTRSAYFVDWIGELLVRQNIAQFARLLEKLDPGLYDRTVNGYQHRHFGMKIEEGDLLRFEFHISLIQRILTEDLEAVFGT
jgi:hypothetical protein